MGFDPQQDAFEAYAIAQDRADAIRTAWEELGRPIMTEGGATGRAPVAHPLLKAMNDADGVADKLRERVRKSHRGPQPKMVLGGRVGKSGSAKLRSVKAS